MITCNPARSIPGILRARGLRSVVASGKVPGLSPGEAWVAFASDSARDLAAAALLGNGFEVRLERPAALRARRLSVLEVREMRRA